MKDNLLVLSAIVALIICIGYLLYEDSNLNKELRELKSMLNGSNWVGIAQECVRTYTEDEWVKNNCNLVNGNMTCIFKWKENQYESLLSQINVSYMIQNGVGEYCDFEEKMLIYDKIIRSEKK